METHWCLTTNGGNSHPKTPKGAHSAIDRLESATTARASIVTRSAAVLPNCSGCLYLAHFQLRALLTVSHRGCLKNAQGTVWKYWWGRCSLCKAYITTCHLIRPHGRGRQRRGWLRPGWGSPENAGLLWGFAERCCVILLSLQVFGEDWLANCYFIFLRAAWFP